MEILSAGNVPMLTPAEIAKCRFCGDASCVVEVIEATPSEFAFDRDSEYVMVRCPRTGNRYFGRVKKETQ